MDAHVVGHDVPVMDVRKGSGDGVKVPIGEALPDLADALGGDWVKLAASEALEVNYRTMVTCHESHEVSYARGVGGVPGDAAPLTAVVWSVM